jgi:peptide deformylase
VIREILRMGDARLLRVSEPVHEFDAPELHALLADMFDTMRAWPHRRSACRCGW